MTTAPTEQDTKPYAVCNTCGTDLQTPAEQREHMDATMKATGELGITARSHSTTVVNPTPEEVEARRLRGVVESATERALNELCERLDDDVRRGRITEQQVTEQLRGYPDFSDAWADWLANG